MSRILDALQRAEEEQQHAAAPRRDIATAIEASKYTAATPNSSAAQFASVAYRANPVHLRVGGVEKTRAFAAECFRQLGYRLKYWRRSHPLRSLLITSAVAGDGKTMLATNLAETLAVSGERVLLIDGDFRRPGLDRTLGLESPAGLAQVLAGHGSWTALTRQVTPLGFYYLAAGKLPSNPTTLLQDGGLKRLLAETTQMFDWVLVDSSPLTLFADSLYLAEATQGVLLVARERYTPAAELQKALAAVQNFTVVGMVLNATAPTRTNHYYDYYRGDEPSRDARPAAAAKGATA